MFRVYLLLIFLQERKRREVNNINDTVDGELNDIQLNRNNSKHLPLCSLTTPLDIILSLYIRCHSQVLESVTEPNPVVVFLSFHTLSYLFGMLPSVHFYLHFTKNMP